MINYSQMILYSRLAASQNKDLIIVILKGDLDIISSLDHLEIEYIFIDVIFFLALEMES